MVFAFMVSSPSAYFLLPQANYHFITIYFIDDLNDFVSVTFYIDVVITYSFVIIEKQDKINE